MIGRSNVGKSTLINTLVGRKALAKSGGTPGKTRSAVLFQIELQLGAQGKKKNIVLADLPGFGFAKVSRGERYDFRKLVIDYISERPRLTAVCLLQDCRREPEEEELLIWNIAQERGCACAVVVTKTDKLKRGELTQALSKLSALYNNPLHLIVSGTATDPHEVQSGIFGLISK